MSPHTPINNINNNKKKVLLINKLTNLMNIINNNSLIIYGILLILIIGNGEYGGGGGSIGRTGNGPSMFSGGGGFFVNGEIIPQHPSYDDSTDLSGIDSSHFNNNINNNNNKISNNLNNNKQLLKYDKSDSGENDNNVNNNNINKGGVIGGIAAIDDENGGGGGAGGTINEINDNKKNTTPPSDIGFLHAFAASLSVILVSELGDKTFFIAAIMAMRHPRVIVFAGAITALALMTVLSAVFGMAAQVIPRIYTFYISTALFALFGLKMLRDGYYMSASDAQEELEEVQSDLKKREDELLKCYNDKKKTSSSKTPSIISLESLNRHNNRSNNMNSINGGNDDDDDDNNVNHNDNVNINRIQHINNDNGYDDDDDDDDMDDEKFPQHKLLLLTQRGSGGGSNLSLSSSSSFASFGSSVSAKGKGIAVTTTTTTTTTTTPTPPTTTAISSSLPLTTTAMETDASILPINNLSSSSLSLPSLKINNQRILLRQNVHGVRHGSNGSLKQSTIGGAGGAGGCCIDSTGINSNGGNNSIGDLNKIEMLTTTTTSNNKLNKRFEKESNSSLMNQDPELGVARKSKGKTTAFNLTSRILMQAFTMTFLAEWGDRSQLTTILLAARENVLGVILGGVIGHSLCTGLAVIGGRMIAQRISVRTVTLVGGVVFILFAISALFLSPNEEQATTTAP